MPETKALREQIRREAVRYASTLDRSRPLTKESLQRMGEELLVRLGLNLQSYLGFAMVALNNEFWRDQLMAIDFKRRLLLLPHCLKHAEGCPADYDEFGLDCRKCGACSIADFKVQAEDLGYKVMVAEGTPIVLKIIVSGYIDAIIGVACLNVLEKALDKVLSVGVPSLAVPLLSSDCKNTSVDEDWVAEVIGLRTTPPPQRTRSYVPLLRAAHELFEGPVFERLAPRLRRTATPGPSDGDASAGAAPSPQDPVAATEALAFEWIGRGGKRFRPFITLAAYDALRGGTATLPDARDHGIDLPDPVRRAAAAVEVFHKASLVHDDIEDGDDYRYGGETLHRRYGVPVALNVGDYLVGLGYRLAGQDAAAVGGDSAASILHRLAEAQVRLSEGQGAELLWRRAGLEAFTPLDALKIYALKTAPAFEAAFFAGLRLAGPIDGRLEVVTEFSKNLGVAFQILNDLKDWQEDENKIRPGGDAAKARPTLLLALALEAAGPEERRILLEPHRDAEDGQRALRRVRRVYERCRAFDKAGQLVEKYRSRAEAAADEAEPIELRALLYFLIDSLLAGEMPERPEALVSLPIQAE
ncbi:MAG: polyprenyl synthetase family protein [Planctomycetes bacterium]|nr:polyprenyl synthetase family protein [Planctomycetota bacterium]